MRRPRLNVLRTFEAAGRRLSFSHAATELNISQAAVSQQIRHLEAYLGEALFVRHHRAITLTGIGKEYLAAVHEALERLDNVTDQLFGAHAHLQVSIRCTSSVATLWLAPEIRSFQSSHPGVELQIITLEQDGILGQINSADIEIFVSDETAHGPEVVPLLTATVVPVAAPSYLSGRAYHAPADIIGSDLIHITGYRDDWHRWFHTQGVGDVTIPRGLTVDSSLFAIDAALRGEGIFLGRRPFLDAHLKSGELVEVFAKPYHLHAPYFLRQQSGAKHIRNRNQVSAWLKELANRK
jgi:LysR family transcriptional regulator, glycine cleavage system transcriptional activator